jgi:aminocarboxymuconate-semialdehyde decarboxylase
MPVVDFHTHLLEPTVMSEATPHNVASGFGSFPPPPPGSRFADVRAKMISPVAHVEDMDRLGIDIEVASSSTVVAGGEWATPAADLDLNRRLNDTHAEAQRAFPERIVGSFTLPLQDVERSLAELERAIDELGLRVANIPANVKGVYVGDRSLWPIWEALHDRQIVVFLHPHGVTDPWYLDYGLWNSVGQAVEETRALSSMIYEGLLDRFEDLKLVISHGGGYLPHYYGRHDRNVQNMPESARNIRLKPSEYLSRLYYDTCVYAPEVLSALVDRVGFDRLVMGSDYPVGDPDPIGFIDRCERLSPEQAQQVKGGTAASLLGLSDSHPDR